MRPRFRFWFVAMVALGLTAVVIGERPTLAAGSSVYHDSQGRFTLQV